MRVGFTSSMVEETEAVNDAADISNCISLTSNQATLTDCDVQESQSQNAEIADVQMLPTIAVNDAWVEDTAGIDVNPAPQIIEKPILKNAELEQRPRNVEEGNYHSDGTRSGSSEDLRKQSSKEKETNPLWAAIKSFIAAFIKFWEE